MKKLRLMKEKIRNWINLYKERNNNGLRILKSELHSLDLVIDKGDGSDGVINR